MLIVEYSSDGIAVPDFHCEERALGLFNSHQDQDIVSVSTDNIITAFKMLVAEGSIPHKEIAFKYMTDHLTISHDGQLSKYPTGFCDFEEKHLYRLLKARRALRNR